MPGSVLGARDASVNKRLKYKEKDLEALFLSVPILVLQKQVLVLQAERSHVKFCYKALPTPALTP